MIHIEDAQNAATTWAGYTKRYIELRQKHLETYHTLTPEQRLEYEEAFWNKFI